jgi:hypothetical protein
MTAEAPFRDVLSVVLDPETAGVIADELERRLAAWIPRSDALRDPVAEGLLVRAALSGDLSHDDIPELRREYFTVAQHGWLWELTRETRDLASLAAMLIERGYRGPSAYLIDYLRSDWEPQTPLVDLVQMAATVRQLWWVRRWHTAFAQLDRLVCARGITHTELLDRLRAVAKETLL